MFHRSVRRFCAPASSAVATLASTVKVLVPHPSRDDVLKYLSRVKSTEELVAAISMVNHVLALCPLHESTNDRQDYFHRICEASYMCRDSDLMWEEMTRCRSQGMLLTRPQSYSLLNALRRSMECRFEKEGRNPDIVNVTYSRVRQFLKFCEEDGVLLDYMLWNRVLILMLHLMSLFDRQLLYRDKWNYSTMKKREGLFVDFVIGHEHHRDYVYAVEETMKLLDEVVDIVKKTIPTRPSFAFMYRVAEIAFACDDFDKMFAAMEDMRSLGMFYPESLTSRLCQLATGFNIPTAMEIFVDWRVYHDNSKLNSFDFFRVLAFYCRAGGGYPCPKCGESYNHRNISVEHWRKTPDHQKNCEYLALARTSKGLYNDLRDIPQNRDWSSQALGTLRMAQTKGTAFSAGEWRLFLLCCTFSPKANEAYDAVLSQFPQDKWDDILLATALRLHRFNDPLRIMPTLRVWKKAGRYIHNVGLNEALMGVCNIEDPAVREEHLREVVDVMQTTGAAPNSIPLEVVSAQLNRRCLNKVATEGERTLLTELSHWGARTASRMKRSFWETVPGSNIRHKQYPIP